MNSLGRYFQRYQCIRVPLFSQLLELRFFCWALIAFCAGHLLLVNFHLPGWTCPLYAISGIPCPGCGLSHSTISLLKGQFLQAITIHAFSPLFLLAILLTGWISLGPDRFTQPFISRLSRFERKTGITALLLISLVFYWLIRLIVYSRDEFRVLLR